MSSSAPGSTFAAQSRFKAVHDPGNDEEIESPTAGDSNNDFLYEYQPNPYESRLQSGPSSTAVAPAATPFSASRKRSFEPFHANEMSGLASANYGGGASSAASSMRPLTGQAPFSLLDNPQYESTLVSSKRCMTLHRLHGVGIAVDVSASC